MPLIIISGHPCTGKTTFSEQLFNKLKTIKDPEKIFLINEENLHLDREEFYKDATHEKMLRQNLKSAVDHSLNANTYVILDSLNYIKGYRYELYCIARSQRTPHCVVQVDCTLETSLAWNTTENGTRWPLSILQDLRLRYEKPNEINRWDKPLFYIDMTSQKRSNENQRKFNYESKFDSFSEDGEDLASNINQLKVSSPISDTIKSTSSIDENNSNTNTNDNDNTTSNPIESNSATTATTTNTEITSTEPSPPQTVFSSWKSKKKNSSSTQSVVSQMTLNTKRENEQKGVYFSGNKVSDNEMLDENRSQNSSNSIEQVIDDIINYFETAIAPAPNLATKPVRHAGPELLYQLDRVSQIIVQLITTHQQEHNDGTPLILKDFNSHILALPRYIGAQELQRLRRQFVKMNSAHPPENSVDVGGKFVEFLKTQIV